MFAAVYPLIRTRAFSEPFDYDVPAELQAGLCVGALVVVPLGAQKVFGLVVELAEHSAHQGRLLPLLDIVDLPAVPRELIELARHVSDYYLSALLVALALVTPPTAALRVEKRVVLTEAGLAALAGGEAGLAPWSGPAKRGGAANLTLCDTNGGTMLDDFRDTVVRVVREFGGENVGVHCHNDSGLGVAVSLAGVAAGATLVQGTVNGYGERTGNPNLMTVLPNLFLKMGRTAFCRANLGQLRELSHYFDELANQRPNPKEPYVGASAFAHKGGLHANAAQKVARSYEHIDPAAVGNRTRVLVSDMAGRSSVVMKARELGFDINEQTPAVKGVLEELKRLEFEGYEFEAADASLKLLLARRLKVHTPAFEFEGFRVIIERRGPESSLVAEATVKVKVNGKSMHTVAECVGPISALDKALRLALERAHPSIKDTALSDYKVRILDSRRGTNSRTRVLIETSDHGEMWGTVGVSDNVIEASWEALCDSFEYKLLREEEKKRAGGKKTGDA